MRTSSTDLSSRITKMQSESRRGEDGQVEAKRGLAFIQRHELFSNAPKTLRVVPVDRLLTRLELTHLLVLHLHSHLTLV